MEATAPASRYVVGAMTSLYGRLSTLSAPVRVRLLRLLEVEELTVGEVARVVQLPQSTVSRHLKELHDDGWVERRRHGTATFFALRRDLDEGAVALWEVVRSATDGDHAEDGLRLAAVLAARETDSRAFFGRVGAAWPEVRRELFGDVVVPSAVAAMLPPGLRVADFGCGTGDMLATLAPWAGRVTGIDREPEMLAAAARRLADVVPASRMELREGTLDSPPITPGEFDVGLLVLVLHHVEEPASALAAAARGLATGGRLVLVDMVAHDREDYRRTMGHRHLGFEPAAVATWLAAAGLHDVRVVTLPAVPHATGPGLFVAVGTR
jgi:ArsR family transcriptional regulator